MSDDWFDEISTETSAAATPSLSVVSQHEQGDQDWFDTNPESVAPQPGTGHLPAASPRRLPRRPPRALIVTGVLAVTGVVVVCAAILMKPAGSTPPSVAEPTLSAVPTAVSTTAAKSWCAEIGVGQPVSETSTEPGLAAIAAFEKAYYVDRDAITARLHVAADARVGGIDELRAGIDTIPEGTTHCVLATAVQPDMWSVELYARQPDGPLNHYSQTITTIAAPEAPKGALITAILPRGKN
ncbi:hypothetical protein ACL02S_23375 [Nocardia sp. 004]|uniref:hypothetical protein n=1 Tax=Nocardia sp. 004 TaxID=3385978 RepID=UPI0039A032CD